VSKIVPKTKTVIAAAIAVVFSAAPLSCSAFAADRGGGHPGGGAHVSAGGHVGGAHFAGHGFAGGRGWHGGHYGRGYGGLYGYGGGYGGIGFCIPTPVGVICP
jgi:hypothetical protein